MSLSASAAPSENFDLDNWKITLPVDSSGGFGGTAVEVQDLTGYQNAKYFFTAPDGSMVFRAPVEGATTSGSRYARSELREMNGSDRAAWQLSKGGVMTATLEVDEIPRYFDGTPGKVVVGQIHGRSDELVRLYWDNNKAYFVNDQSGSDDSENKFYFFNANKQQPDISLNEKFSYVIDAKGSSLEVTVYADGDVYKSVTPINSVWQSDYLYFKAGTYLGVNETQGKGWGQTSFYDVRFNHTDTALTPPNLGQQPSEPQEPAPAPSEPAPQEPAPQEPAPAPQPAPVPQEATPIAGLTGTADANIITGTANGDKIYAAAGNDVVHGLAGADSIAGGTGTDVIHGGAGNDTLYGNDGWDTLIGGEGADRLSGGAGGDRFRFDSLDDSKVGSADTISYFSSWQKDKIVLSGIDADLQLAGDQAFEFIGQAKFSGSAGELRYEQSDGDTFIQGDVNGDGLADLLIIVDQAVTFSSGQFVL